MTLRKINQSRHESRPEPRQLAAAIEEIARRVAEEVLSQVSEVWELDPWPNSDLAPGKPPDKNTLVFGELARLRAENSRLRQENDTLKMAVLSLTTDSVRPGDRSRDVKLTRTSG